MCEDIMFMRESSRSIWLVFIYFAISLAMIKMLIATVKPLFEYVTILKYQKRKTEW